jgi:glutamyl-tRNA synthetase
VQDETVDFFDEFSGAHHFQVAAELGDFVIAKADGTAAYQLAVVVDDAEMGVDQVVRGNDLLDSTPRQILLYRALGLTERIPQYIHLPLIIGADGRRLAKRHGDTRLATYRERGVSSNRILSLLAKWCGMEIPAEGIELANLVELFSLDRVPKGPIIFSAADDAWLRAGSPRQVSRS